MSSLPPSCSIDGCLRPYKCKGFCAFHYKRFQTGIPLDAPLLRAPGRTCTYPGCERDFMARGYCGLHYKRFMAGRDMEGKREVKTCVVEGCHKDARARGFCKNHYRSLYYKNRPSPTRRCSVENCDRPHHARDLCEKHYLRHNAGVTSPEVENNRYSGRGCFIEGCPNSAGGRTGLCKSHGNWAGKYKFSPLQAIQILNSGYSCAICDQKIGRFSINIDHDHSCCPGQSTCGNCIRGFLCRACNRAIGSFSENRENVRRALAYLEGNR